MLSTSSLRPSLLLLPERRHVYHPASRSDVLPTAPAKLSLAVGGIESAGEVCQSRRRRRTSRDIECGAAAGGGITEIDESRFTETVLECDLPVLVEFVATWCGPCRLISPAMEWVAQEYKERLRVVKIDHDANPKLIERYKVYGLPTLILFKNGEEVADSRREGVITKMKLKEYLDPLLDSISVS